MTATPPPPRAVGPTLDTTDRRAVEVAFPIDSKVRVVRPLANASEATGTDGRRRSERFPAGSVETVRGYDKWAGAWRLLVADNKGWVLECCEVEAVTFQPKPYTPEVLAAIRAEDAERVRLYPESAKSERTRLLATLDALQARLAAAEWVVGAARVVATDVLAAAGHRLTWKEKDALLALRASLPTPPAPSTDKENA